MADTPVSRISGLVGDDQRIRSVDREYHLQIGRSQVVAIVTVRERRQGFTIRDRVIRRVEFFSIPQHRNEVQQSMSWAGALAVWLRDQACLPSDGTGTLRPHRSLARFLEEQTQARFGRLARASS